MSMLKRHFHHETWNGANSDKKLHSTFSEQVCVLPSGRDEGCKRQRRSGCSASGGSFWIRYSQKTKNMTLKSQGWGWVGACSQHALSRMKVLCWKKNDLSFLYKEHLTYFGNPREPLVFGEGVRIKIMSAICTQFFQWAQGLGNICYYWWRFDLQSLPLQCFRLRPWGSRAVCHIWKILKVHIHPQQPPQAD